MHASPQQLSHALDRLFDAVSPSLRRAPLFTAVSGGADSLSLAHIAQQYADRHGLAHEALVVNHNIRPEAHNEALAVMAELARHNIRAELLAIDMKAPDSAIQHWARQQRFARLAGHARASGGVLLFGHHADDQAETILMRLNNASSIAGLAGMSEVSIHEGVACLRPFLSLPKSALLSYCAEHDLGYVTDKSNFDPKFERVRMRQFLQCRTDFAGKALQMGALCKTLDSALHRTLWDWLSEYLLLASPVDMRLARQPFDALAPSMQRYLLRYMMQFVGGSTYPARFDAVADILPSVLAGKRSTLSGCYIYATSKAVIIQAEWGRKSPAGAIDIPPDTSVVYENRWIIRSAAAGLIMRYGELKQAHPEAAQTVLSQLDSYASRPRDMIPCFLGLDGRPKAPHFIRDRDRLYSDRQADERAIQVWPKHIPELLDGFFRYGHPMYSTKCTKLLT